MKNLIFYASYFIFAFTYGQKYASQDEINVQKFGTETLYQFKKSNEPLDGHFKIATGGGAYFEASFSKGRINGIFKIITPKVKLSPKKATKMANWTENRLLFIQKEIFPKKNIIKKEN